MDAMQTKKTATLEAAQGARAEAVSEGTAQAALRRGPTRELAPDEERVMRMRLGASPPSAAPLERAAAERCDLEIELLAAEIEAHLRWKEHQAAIAGRAAPRVAPRHSRTKEKIVRALRKKA
jgi:hypothetical protein